MEPRVKIVVFTIKGCPACGSLKSKLHRIAARYAYCVPVQILDAEDPNNANWADYFRIKEVPVTLALRQPHGVIRLEGDLDVSQIEWVFSVAVKYNGC